MELGLRDKVVLVSGASGAIGAETSKRFSEEGARLAIHFHRNRAAAVELKASYGKAAEIFGGDLSSENDVARVFGEIENKMGPVEILVANSGIYEPAHTPIHQMSLEQWNRTLCTNLTSMFLCLREFFRGIQRHQLAAPAAVLVGSTAGIYGEAGHCDYAASKAAATFGFMLSLKNELTQIAPQGRINAVCPSWVVTPMAGEFLQQPEAVRRALQTVPLRKFARPNDVASAILFLSSGKLSGHISGQTITVAGGMEGRVIHSPDQIDLNKI